MKRPILSTTSGVSVTVTDEVDGVTMAQFGCEHIEPSAACSSCKTLLLNLVDVEALVVPVPPIPVEDWPPPPPPLLPPVTPCTTVAPASTSLLIVFSLGSVLIAKVLVSR